MPKLLHARAPHDDVEERQIRRLAQSRHAPGDWILRARMIVRSWEGRRTTEIASELDCHPQTVRERLATAGVVVKASTPEAFGDFMAGEHKRWDAVREAAGIPLQ